MKTNRTLTTTRQILTGSIATVLSLFSVSVGVSAPIVVTYSTAGTTSFVNPVGVFNIQVETWGGGGAGGAGAKQTAGNNTSQNGGGGGGGAYARTNFAPVTLLNGYTITIPAAAVSGAAGITNGGGIVNGGSVTFLGDSGSTTTAAGGTGGKAANSLTSNATNGQGGGAGGTTAASVGDFKFAGGAGSAGNTGSTSVSGSGGGGAGSASAGGNAVTFTTPTSPTPPSTTTPGAGGTSGGGAGGLGRGTGNTTSQIGGVGGNAGGGGGGAKNVGNSTTLGGNGGLGQITLTYTLPLSWKTGDGTWDTSAPNNWVDVSTSLDTAYVDNLTPVLLGDAAGATGNPTITLNSTFTPWGVTMLSTARDYTITGSGAIADSTRGGTLVRTQVMLAPTNTRTMTLNTANTYTGATTISGGAVNLTGSLNGTAITVSGTAVLSEASTGAIGGAASLAHSSSGISTLAGANSYTGATTVGGGTLVISGSPTGNSATSVNGGTLRLDYSTNDTSKINDSALLTLGGGTVDLTGGTHTEVVASTTLTAGTASSVTRSSGTAVLQMGLITRNAGAAISFGASNIAATSTLNTNGILGAWATIGGTDWASNSTNIPGALITAPIYTDVQRLTPGPITDASTTNVRIIEGAGSTGPITLGSATTTINTLNQSASGGGSGATIDPAGQTLSTSAILIGTGAGALTIGTGIDNGILTAATAAGDLALLNNTANNLTINSVVTDNTSASTLTKMGAGTVILNGINTNTGATTVSAGTLTLAGARTAPATGGFSVGNLAGNTATLNISNGTFNLGTQTTVGTGVDPTIVGIVNQTGGSLTTAGNQLLLGNGTGTTVGSSSTGTYNLSGGILTTVASALGVVLGVNTGTTGNFNLSGTGILSMPATSTLQITRSDSSAASNVTATFTQTGGTATVGILQMGGSNTTPANNAGANATLSLTGGTFTATTFNTLSGANSSTSAITIGGTADVTLPAFPTARGSGSTATVTFNGGKLRPAAASATYMGGLTNAFIKAGGLNIEIASTRDITITQALLTDPISTGGGLTKSGDPTVATTLILTGANTYTGGTTINAGRIQVASAAPLSSGPITITGDSTNGGQLIVTAGATITNNFNISGVGFPDLFGRFGAIRSSTATTTFSGLITLAGDSRFGSHAGNGGKVSGRITGAFAMDFYGTNSANNQTGTFTLQNTGTANDFTGNTSITNVDYAAAPTSTYTGGKTILKLGASEQIPSGTGPGNLVFNGADANHLTILELNGFNETLNGLSNVAAAGAIIRNTTVGASTLTIGDANTTSSFSGFIQDGGPGTTLAITKIGTGTLTFSGTNSYTGLTTVSAGTLQSGINNAITSGNAVTVAATAAGTATLDLATFNQTIGGAGLELGGGTATSAATVTGTGILTLTGAGSALTYNAANAPLGATIAVSTVDLGSAARTITVGESATAANDLTITAAATVQNGSVVKAGTGTLKLDGVQSYNALTANAGTTNVNGVLGITPGAAVVAVTGTGTKLRFGTVSQTLSSLTIGAGATVVFTSGTASGAFSGGGGKSAALGGGSAVVPEPGTLGLLLVGALGMLNRRRRA